MDKTKKEMTVMPLNNGAFLMLSNINNVDRFLESTPDWSWCNGVFSNPKIRIGDADGMTERNGHLLIIETKSPGKDLPTGQRIMYERLASGGKATVLVLWGQKNTYTRFRVYREGREDYKEGECTNEKVKDILRQWEKWAMTR